jgi:hypothetical protein
VLLASAPVSHRAAAATGSDPLSVPLRRVQHGVTVLASGQLFTESVQVPLDSEVSLLLVVASADVWYFALSAFPDAPFVHSPPTSGCN